MIRATTKLFAVIGDPIEHSLSPVLQGRFIRLFGLDAVYTAFRVVARDVEACIQGMKAMGIGGLNITVPHKEAVVRYAQQISEEVRALQVANTLYARNGRIHASVTDPYGFLESLGKRRELFKEANVLLFGAGGAATSVTFALATLDIRQLVISDVVAQKAEILAKKAVEQFGIQRVLILDPKNTAINDVIADSYVIINATAVGMYPDIHRSVIRETTAISSRHFVYDLIYNPETTRLLAEAREKGAEVQNGLDMLIFQGLESLRIWMDDRFELSKRQLSEVQQELNLELRNG